MPNKLTAPGSNVLVEPIYEKHIEGSTIFQVHDKDRKTIGQAYGIVMAVGPKYPWALKVGDKIMFRRHEGSPVDVDGVECLSLKAAWVECVVV